VATEGVEWRPPHNAHAKVTRLHPAMSLLDAELALLLLKDDLAARTAGTATQASKNRSRELLGCLQVVKRLCTDVDADDAAVSIDDNTRFGGSWHFKPPFAMISSLFQWTTLPIVSPRLFVRDRFSNLLDGGRSSSVAPQPAGERQGPVWTLDPSCRAVRKAQTLSLL